MGASGLAHGRIDAATITVALANSFVIAVYSVIDGQGARISGPAAPFAFAYNAWADALTALAYGPVVVFLRGRTVAHRIRQRLAARARRRACGLCRLRHRDLGHDPGADRRRRCFARNLCRVRRADRRRALGEPFRMQRAWSPRLSSWRASSCLTLGLKPEGVTIGTRILSWRACPLKIDLAARAWRIEHGREGLATR